MCWWEEAGCSPASWSRFFFLGLVLLLAVQRILELRRSARHEALLLEGGGREHAARHFGAIRLMHTLWFVTMLVEVFLLNRPFVWPLAVAAFVLVALGQTLRLAAIRTLGGRWTVRILTPAQGGRIEHGIYRYLRHPNYMGVVLEVAAFPLLHTAWVTACVFTFANAVLLMMRIKAEEAALSDLSG